MHSELLQLLLRLSLKEHLKEKGGADEMCGPNTFTTLKRGKLESFHFNNSLSLLFSFLKPRKLGLGYGDCLG